MKNYLKISIFSVLVMLISTVFISCENESIDESDQEVNLLEKSENLLLDTISKEAVSTKLVALYSTRNGTYISSENGGNVTCNRQEIGPWETITMITWEDGTISFKGNNGLFLSDENGATNIKFDRAEAGLWEKFQTVGGTGEGVGIIRAGEEDGVNFSYLNGSDTDVNFNIDNGGVYRDFTIINLGEDIVSEKLVALYSTRNGTYISSENGGNVTCNRQEVGPWETITMVTWGDGTISFKGNNGLFLSDGHGDLNIQFEKEVAGTFEKFIYNGSTITSVWDGESTLNGSDTDVVFNTDGVYWDFDIIELPIPDPNVVSEKSVAIKSIRRDTYLSSENGENVTLSNRTEVGTWETFTMVTWKDGTISFKGNNGLYLSDGHGNSNIKFDAEEAGTFEKFTYANASIISVWGDFGDAVLGDVWDEVNRVYNTTFTQSVVANSELTIIEL
ncbi:hypothetical protein GCM10022393_25580 [Aquimarina addita]|uniref:Fascin domain-containing protein n=1 Tax=Aquimarina addita TaxID=870485 RepID=A0ABP6UQ21_9FLAO